MLQLDAETVLRSTTDAPPLNVGIAIIANDKVLHWLVPFLESWKTSNAHLPLYLIPYDDNVSKTRRIAEIYGAQYADVDCRELDALSKKLFPLSLGKRFRLRKLLSLVLPLDEVIYLDVDIILFRSLDPLVGHVSRGDAEFLVISETNEYVYNKNRTQFEYLRNAMTFNDGFFITSNKLLTIDDFYTAMEADEKTFDQVRQRGGLYAQPLTNFVVHRKGLKVVPAYNLVPSASGESYHKAQGVSFEADGPVCENGREIYFAHWPGITGVPKGHVFDDAWARYSERGHLRLADKAS